MTSRVVYIFQGVCVCVAFGNLIVSARRGDWSGTFGNAIAAAAIGLMMYIYSRADRRYAEQEAAMNAQIAEIEAEIEKAAERNRQKGNN